MRYSFSIVGFGLLCFLVTAMAGCGENSGSTAIVSSMPADDPIDQTTGSDAARGSDQGKASSARSKISHPIGDQSVADSDGPVSDSGASEARSVDVAGLQLKGLEALQAGEIDEAYRYARQAMQANRDDPQVIFLMAMVFAERHRFPEAIKMLEEVAESTPEARLPAMGQIADWSVRYGKWAQAEDQYREILEQVPTAVMAHRKFAELLLRQGRRLEAHSHLNRLCLLGDVTENELRAMLNTSHPFVGDANKDVFDPIGPLGVARVATAQGNWQDVRDQLERLEMREPWESALLARAYAVLNDQAKLRSWVLAADPSVGVSPDAWFAKGVYGAQIGKPMDATRCFAEALLLDPTDAEVYTRFAETLSATGATKQAEEAGRRAQMLQTTIDLGTEMAVSDDRNQESLLQLSEVLAKLGRPFESLGWRGVWLTYADGSAAVSKSEGRNLLRQIVDQRTLLLQQGQTEAPAEFVLCGVDLATLPSLEEIDKRLASLGDAPTPL